MIFKNPMRAGRSRQNRSFVPDPASVLAASLLIYMTYTFSRGAVAPGIPWNKVLP